MKNKSAQVDLNLIEQFKSKDKKNSNEAFNKLFKKYYSYMFFHFKKYNQNEDITNELIIDTFLKVFKKIESFDEKKVLFSTWIFNIAKNVFVDKFREQKRDILKFSENVEDYVKNCFDNKANRIAEGTPNNCRKIILEISCKETPEKTLIVKERNKKICTIIDKMQNKEYANLIKMRFFEGLSYKDISIITNKPIGTTKARIHRAKAELKKQFEKNGIEI